MKRLEICAILITILAITVGISSPFAYERFRLIRIKGDADRVITLTGVAYTGTWTTERVNSVNYGFRQFKAARLVLTLGETVVFRLKSADGTHSFYVPELGIGPVEV